VAASAYLTDTGKNPPGPIIPQRFMRCMYRCASYWRVRLRDGE
jgi:hypothetical protein